LFDIEKRGEYRMLLYILFALTIAMVLTALFAPSIPEQRRGEAFIAFFIALLLAGGVVIKWLVPAIAADRGGAWMPALMLVIFAATLIVSALLSIRRPGSFVRAGGPHNHRQDAEALAFDIALWLLMLIFGIVIMRSLGL
jgi:uncharacterized membrane protein YidH (DUF202 family)